MDRWLRRVIVHWNFAILNRVLDGIYDDIRNLDKYPLLVSKQVLGILIQSACVGQNMAPIELGRKKIGEIINHDWLVQYFMEVADQNIDYSDVWEFRRLSELVILCVPELKENVLAKGANSEDEEIREAAEDYRDKTKENLFR